MKRSFIAITAIGSTLMFAGVWIATEPRATAVPAIVDTTAATDTTAVAAPAFQRHGVGLARPISDAEPYNVAPPAYRSSKSARRSTISGPESAVFYSGCRDVRAAGAAPLHRGQPGYRAGRDGDGDGIACENYR